MVTFVRHFGVLRKIPLLFRRKLPLSQDDGKTEIKSVRYLGAELWPCLCDKDEFLPTLPPPPIPMLV